MSDTSIQEASQEQSLETYVWDSNSGGLLNTTGTQSAAPTQIPEAVVEVPTQDTIQPQVQVETPTQTIQDTVEQPTQPEEEEVVAQTEETVESTTEEPAEPNTPEETEAPEPEIVDNYYIVEAERMLQSGEINVEGFNPEEATPEKIREAWRQTNLGPIAENAQKLGLARAEAVLKTNYGEEVLEISRRIANGINEDTMDNLMAYKEAALVDIDELGIEEQNEYIKDYLVDKGLEEDIANYTLKAAETEDAQRDLAEKAKEHFTSQFNNLNQTTKEKADLVSRQRQEIEIQNQNFVQNVFQTGQIHDETMSTEQLMSLQKGLVEKVVPVQTSNGQTVNVSQYEAFEQQVLNNYPLRVYLFKTLLHKGQTDTVAKEKIKAEVEDKIDKRWGRRVVKQGDKAPSSGSKGAAPKKEKTTQNLESYVIKNGELQAS